MEILLRDHITVRRGDTGDTHGFPVKQSIKTALKAPEDFISNKLDAQGPFRGVLEDQAHVPWGVPRNTLPRGPDADFEAGFFL
jgi:hypothetical protein